MPPKAMDKTMVDDLLCDLMPKKLSKATRLALINDTDLRTNNVALNYNYNQLNDVASTIDITLDFKSLAIHACNCIESLKNILNGQ